ncbi:hypothetical protein CROQUDRAFT_101391 [Cronartium quercuum f. sp. fusiforme G11]|uniref:Uncharacterized protein n=1 Tax=Cronartium quercuum f. sp. fusiforme G11 TaxID=708437 RepID=A0A9P6T6L4_9BASI|nr:hypothetical protein CROQUDRAFT_101391 [Cronartium quercuum f. sp. fusiforme G11]
MTMTMTIHPQALKSLSSTFHHLTSLLVSPSPPPFIYLHSPSNLPIISQFLNEILDQVSRSTDPINLPCFAYVDLIEVQNSRSLYDRVLNQLAGWNPSWTDDGPTNWNGQTQGLELVSEHNSQSSHQSSRSPTLPDKLVWDYSVLPEERVAGILSGKKNDSFDAFCDGLRTISKIRYTNNRGQQSLFTHRPKFIIINQAARLREWKEFNLISALSRLPEISRSSVHTIFLSHLPWNKVRPRYGATEPTIISIPKLSDQDLIKILISEGPPPINESSNAETVNQVDPTPAFEPFVTFIVSAFQAQTSSDLFELSTLVSRLWTTWTKRVRDGEFSPNDTAKLILLNRSMIEAEQQQFGCPVWHVPDFLQKEDSSSEPLAKPTNSIDRSFEENLSQEELISHNSSNIPSSSSLSSLNLLKSPTKFIENPNVRINSPFTTPSKPKHYLNIFYSDSRTPSNQINLTPSKPYNPKNGPPMTERQKPKDTISLSLTISSRYLLIASYITSYNPIKSDIKLFITFDENNQKKKVRKLNKPKIGEDIKVRERQELLGPKPFTLNRLMAIFHSITNQEGLNFHQIDILQQVGTLIQSKLINRVGTKLEKLESIKLVCGVSEPIVQSLCKSLGFDLRSRLWENQD